MANYTEIFKSSKGNIYVECYYSPMAKESAILVNGAMSTTASFSATVRNLKDKMNLILFDLPFIGNSAPHNPGLKLITKKDEVAILEELIEHYQPDNLISVSWGGLASLMTLSHRPSSIKRAVITAFSTRLNKAMYSYVIRAKALMENHQFEASSELLNQEIGKYLPRALKRVNYRHLCQLSEETYAQVIFHIEQIMKLDHQDYVSMFDKIDIPLLFINGEKDEYTTLEDIKVMGDYLKNCRFCGIPQAGHFLDLESKESSEAVGRELLTFFNQSAPVRQIA
ncbi:alpha/beta fold hydrolase [Celerinatantimonas sp. YJH-8]|uniref:alpha/beta fold hydrolase n=1 Tax=Celerinatantimonas sp. YJH-8 TaxID=3228714 RepID=UPI0038BF9889